MVKEINNTPNLKLFRNYSEVVIDAVYLEGYCQMSEFVENSTHSLYH